MSARIKQHSDYPILSRYNAPKMRRYSSKRAYQPSVGKVFLPTSRGEVYIENAEMITSRAQINARTRIKQAQEEGLLYGRRSAAQ